MKANEILHLLWVKYCAEDQRKRCMFTIFKDDTGQERETDMRTKFKEEWYGITG